MAEKKPGKRGPKARPSLAAIKKRYLQGEKPAAIARDYGITSQQVSEMAKTHKWVAQRRAILENVTAQVEDELQRLTDETIRVHAQFMTKLLSQMHLIENPYLFDGERVNGLFQTAMNNAVKLAMAKMQINDEASNNLETDAIGFVGLPGVDISAL